MKRQMTRGVLALSVLFVAAALALAFMPAAARSDIIWEPVEDSYYQKHIDECTETGDRSFTANSPTGTVTVYKSPEDATVIDTMENGDSLTITWTCPDAQGKLWGCGPKYSVGWIPMDYMVENYGSQTFREEFARRIGEGLVYLSDEYTTEDICYWEYPGSSVLSMELRADYGNSAFSLPFVDDAGRTWGYESYYHGMCGWVCLDDPTNETIYETMTDPAEAYYASITWYTEENIDPTASLITPDTSAQKKQATAVEWAVIVVCSIACGLLYSMKRRRRLV